MAHEISIRTDGFVEHAYAGAVGWHGLGNQLASGAGIAEWMQAAGMDWTIQRGIVRYATAAGQDSAEWASMPDKVVLMRSDSKAALGVVSDSYKPVQPRQVLEFFRDLAGDNGFTLDTAGVLFGGKRFWALARIGADAYVRDTADKVKGYLLLCTSADGTMATEGRFVCERVVCNNTLEMARGERDGGTVKISHRTRFNESDMKKKLGVVAESAFSQTMDELRKLAATPLHQMDALRDTVNLLHPGTYDDNGNPTVETDKVNKILRSAPVTRIGELALDRRGLIGGEMAGMEGTAYGWLNAVTQYVDHEARAHNDDNRMNSALLGRGADMKTTAHNMALARAGAYIAPATLDTASVDGGDILADLLSRPLRLS